MNKNFWYISCLGYYASGIWLPFETKKEAIDYLKKHIKEKGLKIISEGYNKWNEWEIKTEESYDFDTFDINQRKDNEIIKEEYIE